MMYQNVEESLKNEELRKRKILQSSGEENRRGMTVRQHKVSKRRSKGLITKRQK